jgi:hypothetical protein
MVAPVQRGAIEGERQYFTLRQTRHSVPMRFSMMSVQARERRSSAGRPSRVTGDHLVEPFEAETPSRSFSREAAPRPLPVSSISAYSGRS